MHTSFRGSGARPRGRCPRVKAAGFDPASLLPSAGGRLCVHEGILPPPPSLWSDGGSLSHTFLRNVRKDLLFGGISDRIILLGFPQAPKGLLDRLPIWISKRRCRSWQNVISAEKVLLSGLRGVGTGACARPPTSLVLPASLILPAETIARLPTFSATVDECMASFDALQDASLQN